MGEDYIVEHGVTVEANGDVESVDRLMSGVQAPPLYARTMNTEGPYGGFHCTEFHAPSFHILHSGITGTGRPREDGYLIKVLNGITPIDADHSLYYYAFSRNFAVDQEWATQESIEGLATVLDEDKNAGIAKARRVMERLLIAEKASPRG
ncbi:MAG: hypothetical protein Q7L55_04890 [Actinomycetota bacterium]|nr:hypothetical protein [Actinomycetota bacterium]